MQLVLCEAAAAEVCGLHICMYLHTHCLHPSKVPSFLSCCFRLKITGSTRASLDNTLPSPTSPHPYIVHKAGTLCLMSLGASLAIMAWATGDTWLHRLTRPVPCRSSRQRSMSRAYCSAHMMSVSRLLQPEITPHDLVYLNCSGDHHDVPTNDVYDSPADLRICRL